MPLFPGKPRYWLSSMTCFRDDDCLAVIAIARTRSIDDFAYLGAPFLSKLVMCGATTSSFVQTLTDKMESYAVCMHFGCYVAKL